VGASPITKTPAALHAVLCTKTCVGRRVVVERLSRRRVARNALCVDSNGGFTWNPLSAVVLQSQRIGVLCDSPRRMTGTLTRLAADSLTFDDLKATTRSASRSSRMARTWCTPRRASSTTSRPRCRSVGPFAECRVVTTYSVDWYGERANDLGSCGVRSFLRANTETCRFENLEHP
jgi:hypothetical protein